MDASRIAALLSILAIIANQEGLLGPLDCVVR